MDEKSTTDNLAGSYDLAIIGTGPAGYTASIYASRYTLSHILVGAISGGQTSESHLIQNFPSYIEIPGPELVKKFREHALSYSPDVLTDTITSISGSSGAFTLKTISRKEIHAKSLLFATGMKRRKLGIEKEDEYLGKGLTYCATCDGFFFKDKTVAVVGGSDSANTASLYLADIASHVYQIYRKDKLRGEPAWANKVAQHPNITVIYNTSVIDLKGEGTLESVILDTEYNNSKKLETDGLFVEIGAIPDTTLSSPLGVRTTDTGYIMVNNTQATNVPGVWAAGDITTGSNNFHQILTASAEGAVAIENIYTTLIAA